MKIAFLACGIDKDRWWDIWPVSYSLPTPGLDYGVAGTGLGSGIY
jgi:hypothetical protein